MYARKILKKLNVIAASKFKLKDGSIKEIDEIAEKKCYADAYKVIQMVADNDQRQIDDA